MKYVFDFYKDEYYDEIRELVLNAYEWDKPAFGLSRFEFAHGLHPFFCGYPDAWERTVGVYLLEDELVACAINEGNDEAQVFFLFREKKYAEDGELVEDMIHFAKTTMAGVKEDRITRFITIATPEWNGTLTKMLHEQGFTKTNCEERILIRAFDKERAKAVLPEGYSFADANTIPAEMAANVHMASFGYGIQNIPNGTKAFASMQKEPDYDPYFHVYVLDPMGRPVAMANIWYEERMPYCELEPLGVAFWERRKGIASALLNECENRVKEKYPECTGMTGGDQQFYQAIGFEVVGLTTLYCLEWEVYPSWDSRSNRKKEV